MEKIGVIGAGSWGTALAILLNENGNDVTLWSHRAEEAAKVQKDREISKLPGIHIPESIAVTADLAETVRGKKVLVLVVPSKAVRETAEKMRAYVEPGTVIVSAVKGIEEGTLFRRSDSAGGDSGTFRPEPCRGGRTSLADGMCHRCPYRRDGTFSAEALYERGVSCVHQRGHARH